MGLSSQFFNRQKGQRLTIVNTLPYTTTGPPATTLDVLVRRLAAVEVLPASSSDAMQCNGRACPDHELKVRAALATPRIWLVLGLVWKGNLGNQCVNPESADPLSGRACEDKPEIFRRNESHCWSCTIACNSRMRWYSTSVYEPIPEMHITGQK